MSDFHGVATPLQIVALVGLCSDGQGCCELLQARIVGFLLGGGVRYRDKDVGSGFLDKA
jgi:hypothetical protein